jgi:uncharacterized protein (TIGR00369 family)
VTLDEIRTYLLVEFDQVFGPEYGMTLDEAAGGEAVVRLSPSRRHQRPGGILSGPTLMAMADAAAYAALLSLGENAKMAVTTNLSINFLRAAPADADLLTRCRTLKNGRRLAVLEAEATSEGSGDIIAHTVLTYSIPPR